MERQIQFAVTIRCTDRQLKSGQKEVERVVAESNVPVEWDQTQVHEEGITCLGRMPMKDQIDLVSHLIERFRKRYAGFNVLGVPAVARGSRKAMDKGSKSSLVVAEDHDGPQDHEHPFPHDADHDSEHEEDVPVKAPRGGRRGKKATESQEEGALPDIDSFPLPELVVTPTRQRKRKSSKRRISGKAKRRSTGRRMYA